VSAELRADLREPAAWYGPLADTHRPEDGRASYCGRYRLLRSNSGGVERFLAFRTRKDGRGQWAPPEVLGGFGTPAAARFACWTHAEAEAVG
jgi:hypothetical protein